MDRTPVGRLKRSLEGFELDDFVNPESGYRRGLSEFENRPTIASETRKRVTRRKHRNSRLGCDECKRRRIKCDEELPECRNCRNRIRKPDDDNYCQCSYLRMSKKEIEEFKAQKLGNNLSDAIPTARKSGSFGAEFRKSQSPSEDDGIEIVMIPHRRVDIPRSIWTAPAGMEVLRAPRSLYVQLLLNCLQDWTLSTNVVIALKLLASIKSHTRKIEIARKENRQAAERDLIHERSTFEPLLPKYRGRVLSFVRHLTSTFLTAESVVADEVIAARLLIGNSTLQLMQMYTDARYSDDHHMAMVDVCLEMYRKNIVVKVARSLQYFWNALPLYHSLIYFPAYSTDLLLETIEVLRDFKPFVLSTNDPYLELHFTELFTYLEYLVSLLPLSSRVLPLSINELYDVYRRWTTNIPPEAFCIVASMSGVHRVFYTFYHSIPAYLNNLFPAACFVLTRQFYGTTAFYPFSLKTILEHLEPELGPFAEFSIRLLAFMERRNYMFRHLFIVKNPLPDSLSKHRFRIRKVCNMKEKQIKSLRHELITWDNYPDLTPVDESPSAVDQVGADVQDEPRYYATEAKQALSQLHSWRAVKDTFSSPLEPVVKSAQNEMSDSLYLDQILLTLREDSQYASFGQDIPAIAPDVDHFTQTGHTLTDRGMLSNDCDISVFFEKTRPSCLEELPPVEILEKYKQDRICVMRYSDENLTV
ncbi:LAFA_0A03092g1_1 [Lachancea sp. 'fantastica']|nr:LAFA_0A03092g1_1 [Lachancea sp. 'fantastica']